MSEQVIQEAFQAQIQSLTEFADASVVINDWGLLDGPVENAPFVIITNADNVTSRRDAPSANTVWQIPVSLYERFTDWPTTLNNFRARRQALVDKFNAAGDARSAGGLDGVTCDLIQNEGGIVPYYPPYLKPEEIPEALPLYLSQTLIFSVEEF